MSSTTDLGKVSIVPKGDYSSTTQYERLDIVGSDGSAYIALRDNIGHNVSDTYYWYELVSAGTGIDNITGPVSSGITDTYTIHFTDGRTTTFSVTNGSNISSIAKTSTSGLVDTYTVTLTNGTTTTFQVTNARSISSITLTSGTHAPGTTDTYTITFNNGTSQTFGVYNGADGSGSVSTVDGVSPSSGDIELLIIGTGAPTTSTVGAYKQRYFDSTNSVIYICTGVSSGSYTWKAAGITVDSSMSSSSTNPVQNKVIYSALNGKQDKTDNSFATTAKTVAGAVNELNSNKQSVSNLVTAFQSTPDNTHYPSEKLVKDKFDAMSTDIMYKASVTDYTGNLLNSSWAGDSAPYSKSIIVYGIRATDKPIVDIVATGTYETDKVIRENWAKIYRVVATNDTLTFYADEVPSGTIPFIARCIR